jgi:riboflavin kinase/FMN adenylyltransferase
MQSIHYISNLNDLKKTPNRDSYLVTIGVFDGVHKGHQSLISQTIAKAKQNGYKTCLISFQNSPYHHIMNLNDNDYYLNTIKEKQSILENFDLDQIILLEFNDELSNTSPHNFLKILKSCVNMESLYVGPDFAIGKKRLGNIKYLNDNQSKFNYHLDISNPYTMNNEIISSTLIKSFIKAGQLTKANSYLGRKYNLSGTVIKGEGRGRELNMPTANLDFNIKKILPKDGVYACKVIHDETSYIGALSIGNNPTFGSDNSKSVEVHLLNFNKSIYNHSINIEIYKHIRDQIKYIDVNELKSQMQIDIINIKDYFDNE